MFQQFALRLDLAPSLYRFSDFTLDPASRSLLWQGQPVLLTAKQFDLLVVLVENAGRPVEKQQLRQLVWPDVHVEENNLTQHIFQLRKALSAVAGQTALLETLPKVGYQFVAPVEKFQPPTRVVAEPPVQPALQPPPVLPPGTASPVQAADQPPLQNNQPAWYNLPRWFWALAVAAVFLVSVSYGRGQWEFWMAEDQPPAKALPSVAVHPLQGELGAGLAAEVASGLGRMDGIEVQVVQPSGGAVGDFNLHGTIQGDRILADLRRRNGELIWHREFSAAPAEASLELTAQVALTLQELAGARRRALAGRKPPANREAYLAYLDGLQHLLARRSTEGRPAIGAFQRALRADPSFSSAYTGMAMAYAWQGINQAEAPWLVWPRARELALRAVALDPENGEARMVLAMVAAYADQNEAEAERLVRSVLASDPASVELQLLAGQMLSRFGRFGEAEAILKQSIHADPTFALGRQILAFHYYQSRQFDLAKREAWRIIRANPRSGTGYGLLVAPLCMTGDPQTASWIIGRAESAGLNQPMVAMGLAYTYGRAGRIDDAKRILQAMDDQAKMMYVSPYQRAVAHMGLGHNDQAVALLRSCLSTGCINPSAPRLEPIFDPLRQRPDFVSLVY